MIRELRDEDVPGVVAVERRLLPPELFVTEAGLRHELRSAPARSLQRAWVADENGEIVGWAQAFFRSGVAEAGAARIAGRGLRTELYDAAEEHLRANGGTRVYAEAFGPADERLLRTRGYEEAGRDHLSAVEPARVDVPRLRPPEGYRLAPLRELRGRPRDLWELDTSARLDVPSDTARTRLPYETWLPHVEHPDLDDDGSVVALHGDRPVAYAFLGVDRETGRAVNEMTGTLPEYRRRGLARLVKLASLRWARDHGILSIWTDNDEDNAAMLALNAELGYRRFLVVTKFARGLETASAPGPAAPAT